MLRQGEPVSATSQGFDARLLGSSVELLPQVRDMRFNHV
jgi:hypothetical protein